MNKGSEASQVHPNDRVGSLTSIKNYIAVFLAQLGCQGLAYSFFASYLSLVFTDYLGVSPAKIGIVLTIGIFVDLLSDIVMGNIVDRVRTKHGKIKHWFFWMALPTAITIALMFMCPVTASESVKIIWVLIIYNLFCTFVTGVRLPTFAFYAAASDNSKTRQLLVLIASQGTTVGVLTVGWAVTPILNMYKDHPLDGWRFVSWLIAGATCFVLFCAGVLITEKRKGADLAREEDARKKKEKTNKDVNLKEQYVNLLKNKYWVRYQFGCLLNTLSLGFATGCMGYFIKHVLTPSGIAGSNPMGALTTVMMLPRVLSPLIVLLVIKFLDSRTITVSAMIVCSISYFILYMNGVQSWVLFATFLGIRGVFSGCVNSTAGVLLTRAIDYGEWKFGLRQEGVGSSFSSAMMKVGTGIATSALGFVLTAYGYGAAKGAAASSVVASAEAQSAITVMFLLIPAITYMLGAFVFFKGMGKKEYEKIRADLDARYEADKLAN